MEAIMIAGVAVVAVGGWYSALDLLADMGVRIGKRCGVDGKSSGLSRSLSVPPERGIKQMAGMNI